MVENGTVKQHLLTHVESQTTPSQAVPSERHRETARIAVSLVLKHEEAAWEPITQLLATSEAQTTAELLTQIAALKAENLALGTMQNSEEAALMAEVARAMRLHEDWARRYDAKTEEAASLALQLTAERQKCADLAEREKRLVAALGKIRHMPWPNSESPYAVIARAALSTPPPNPPAKTT